MLGSGRTSLVSSPNQAFKLMRNGGKKLQLPPASGKPPLALSPDLRQTLQNKMLGYSFKKAQRQETGDPKDVGSFVLSARSCVTQAPELDNAQDLDQRDLMQLICDVYQFVNYPDQQVPQDRQDLRVV